MRRTKIIATIGPASEDIKVLTQLIKAGLNVARLNFSHGSFEEHGARIQNIRSLEKKLKSRVRIMQDLCGPKLRLGDFKDLECKLGQKIKFGQGGVPVQKEIWKWVKNGQMVLIDDGVVELIVTKVTKSGLEAEVTFPGTIRSRKGVSLPGVKVDLPALSEKDLADLEFGIKSHVDGVALSFVKTAAEVEDLRSRIAKLTDKKVSIVSKIETIEALHNIKSIIAASDAIMVARGDLALNVDQNQVPLYQKNIVALCKKAGKPVIVATQMLESMASHPRPTRAEVSDVANAVLDGADAVMLSGETAFGKFPVKTVETMASIIVHAEASHLYNFSKKKDLIKV